MMSTDAPQVSKITRHAGIAGQCSYEATVTYEGEGPQRVTFVGSVYGGPVLMRYESRADLMREGGTVETWVTEPERFGKFGPEWIRRFYA